MSKQDEYRQNVAEAQKEANEATTDANRAGWLEVAQGWLSMLRKRPRTELEKFDAAATAQGTRQETSERSH
jgi:hypothetical protein